MSEDRERREAEAFRWLCGHLGIAAHYDDIWGTRREVDRENLVALLEDFGERLEGPMTAERFVHELQREEWRHPMPPVIAIRASESHWDVRFRLPAAASTVRWQIREEGGVLHQGEIHAHSFPELTRADLDGVPWCERRLPFDLPLPEGYHRLMVSGLNGEALVVSAPQTCYRPAALRDGGRVWGPAIQLYSLRSKRNWGMGDFTDLAQMAVVMAERGADIVGLNPIHAMFPHNPAHVSPYSPSSRQHLNVLYIDVESVEEFADCEEAGRRVLSPAFQATLAGLRESDLVRYDGVAAAKFEILELLYEHFRKHHLQPDGLRASDERGQAFLDFVSERGESLRNHALFEALQEHFHAADSSVWGPPLWPEDYRRLAGAAVSAFVQKYSARVGYYQYLQWLADCQLKRASEQARAAGLRVGLYLDLAVSVDRAGSDVWTEGERFASHASVGAPPDEFNPNGQDWGLPPLRPGPMRENHYRFFIEILRANMRYAGALRIDHVMGLMRLFWIPRGKTAREGAYVHYPAEEMLAIVALESERNQCLVIGEDLGTVADEMRSAMARFDVLSYRLLYFERLDNAAFRPPKDYPERALVAVSTHDLAPLSGWWAGQDLRLRLQLGLFPSRDVFEKQLLDRAQERVRLMLAVREAGLLSEVEEAESLGGEPLSPRIAEAVHVFLAKAPSAVMMVQLEDSLGVTDQINMPGTTGSQPNWRRKMPIDLQGIFADPRVKSLSHQLTLERPRARMGDSARSLTETKVPRATYRIQFHRDFGFDDALKVIPYLERLGVSHVYCSPIQRARAGSMHGYDVVAHNEVNPELGGREAFDRLAAALRERGMGLILDLVPNHMGVMGGDNVWWTDVLENGPSSPFAHYFDIDWKPLNPELTGKVLLPVLGDHYGSVLLRGDVVLRFETDTGSLGLAYFEHRFPLCPESYPQVLGRAEGRVQDPDLAASLASIATAFGHLPPRDTVTPEAIAERSRDKQHLKARLARLVARHATVAQALAAVVAEFNLLGARDELHALIETQAYRLSFWRVAADEINYRRFFDINELAALRMEREDVFEATQSFALDLAAAGAVDGLRTDHPDGLYDPAKYFRRLQEGYARRAGLILPDRDSEGRPARPLYVVAEKIPAAHEEVPEDWHIHGTTGYRFANLSNGLLVDSSSASKFETIWRNFTHVQESFEEIAYQSKRRIIRNALSSELNVLATELVRIARSARPTRDYTLNALRRALADVAACMPVYRTYIIDGVSQQDVRYVDWAVKDAQARSRDADLSVFSFLRQTLLGQAAPGTPEVWRERIRRFAIRFQQYSAPVAAKGVEDTAFYRYFPLSSLNEVGGDPGVFGTSVSEFHAFNTIRRKRWPHSLLASSTHDSKRSEDVRCRIDVLSEMPGQWRLALRRWRSLNRSLRRKVEVQGAPALAPSDADEYLLYQTILGTLPATELDESAVGVYRDRIEAYMIKSAREAKVHTRWIHPDAAYEEALTGFVRGLLGRLDPNSFLAEVTALGAIVARFGAFNSLTTTLLKHTSPGVPDLYQGHEVTNLSLVDPDNRGVVDYDTLERSLMELRGLKPAEVSKLLATPEDGRAKLWISSRLLAFRREQPALFRDGDYRPLEVGGRHRRHVVAFARRFEGATMVAIAGRLFSGLLGQKAPPPLGEEVWADTTIGTDFPEGTRLNNLLTGETLEVRQGRIMMATAFARFPAAVLVTTGGSR